MRLMVEQMAASQVRCFDAVFALIIRVGERPAPKDAIEPRKERLNAQVLSRPAGWKSRLTESRLEAGSFGARRRQARLEVQIPPTPPLNQSLRHKVTR